MFISLSPWDHATYRTTFGLVALALPRSLLEMHNLSIHSKLLNKNLQFNEVIYMYTEVGRVGSKYLNCFAFNISHVKREEREKMTVSQLWFIIGAYHFNSHFTSKNWSQSPWVPGVPDWILCAKDWAVCIWSAQLVFSAKES